MTAAQNPKRTPDADVDRWAVQLPAPAGPVYYGPFEEYPLAERFARFVTEEIDPAKVVPFNGVWPVGGWRSPLLELLNWRDSMNPTRQDWPHLFPPDDPRHVHDTDAAGCCRNPECDHYADGTSADDERESRSHR